MRYRQAGEMTTLETRADAEERVDKKRRYIQILECMRGHEGLTAKEIAEIMREKGYIPTSERNFTAPRLTEMSQRGMVEPIGKKTCEWTGRTVAVYAIREVC